jgi:heme oxygenase
MLQDKLKSATKDNHDTLEELMYVHQIMDGTLSLFHYKQILTTNYLVHKHFEHQLTNGLCPKLSIELDIEHRQKLAALERDLQELAMVVRDNEPDIKFRLDKTDACALGALYVLEGATLGGNVIVKRLKVNANLMNLNLGFHYYQVYGENLINNWKNFVNVLNRQPENTQDASITSARRMFDYIAATHRMVTMEAELL